MKCPHCEHENTAIATYCSTCGKKLIVHKTTGYNNHIQKISFFFFTLLAYIIVLRVVKIEAKYSHILMADVIFAVIVLVFFIIDFKRTIPLLNFRKVKPKLLFKVIGCAVFLSIVVTYLARFLNQNLFNKTEIAYIEYYKDSFSPLLLTIISIALFPAIFEEIAFRGIVFDDLLKITGIKSTILISSILFTLLHLSIISVIWLFPGAIAFGYLRAKNRTMLYGMFGHFIYNSSIVILELIIK